MIVEPPGWCVSLTNIDLGTESSFLERRLQVVNLVVVKGFGFSSHILVDADRDNNNLDLCDTGWEYETVVVAVDHHHEADCAGRETPWVMADEDVTGFVLANLVVLARLVFIRFVFTSPVLANLVFTSLRSSWVLDGNVEHAAEVLSEAMRCCALNTATIGGDIAFDGGCVVAARKLFLLGLAALDDWNGKQLLVDISVKL